MASVLTRLEKMVLLKRKYSVNGVFVPFHGNQIQWAIVKTDW
jgi:hypothetical protein